MNTHCRRRISVLTIVGLALLHSTSVFAHSVSKDENAFRAVYSDHYPIVFQLVPVGTDD